MGVYDPLHLSNDVFCIQCKCPIEGDMDAVIEQVCNLVVGGTWTNEAPNDLLSQLNYCKPPLPAWVYYFITTLQSFYQVSSYERGVDPDSIAGDGRLEFVDEFVSDMNGFGVYRYGHKLWADLQGCGGEATQSLMVWDQSVIGAVRKRQAAQDVSRIQSSYWTQMEFAAVRARLLRGVYVCGDRMKGLLRHLLEGEQWLPMPFKLGSLRRALCGEVEYPYPTKGYRIIIDYGDTWIVQLLP